MQMFWSLNWLVIKLLMFSLLSYAVEKECPLYTIEAVLLNWQQILTATDEEIVILL